MAGTISKRNPMKIMAIVTIVLLIAVIAIVLFKKDKVYLEDESGATYVGASGKLLKTEAEA